MSPLGKIGSTPTVIRPLLGTLAFLPQAQQRQALTHLSSLLEGGGESPLALLVQCQLNILNGPADVGDPAGEMDPEMITRLHEAGHRLEDLIRRPPTSEAAGAAAKLRDLVRPLDRGDRVHPLFPLDSPWRRTDLMPQFGKVVSDLWQTDREMAKARLADWSLEGNRLGREKEIHYFSPEEVKASETVFSLSQRGFEVRQALIPADIIPDPVVAKGLRPEWPIDTFYWVVARPGGNAVARKIHSLFEPSSETVQEDPPLPIDFRILGRRIDQGFIRGERPELGHLILSLLGRAVPLNEILRAFQVDIPGYRMEKLHLIRSVSHLEIHGALATDTGEPAGEFQRVLSSPPPAGGLWLASARGYNPDGSFSPHTGKGLARHLHQRFLGFLYRLGVDLFDLPAAGDGRVVWPHLGFDFSDARSLEAVKKRFLRYLKKRNLWSPPVDVAVTSIRHAWEITDFVINSIPVGRDFLFRAKLIWRQGIKFRFPVGDIHYEGWRRLFKDS